jgi:hypothetical protein
MHYSDALIERLPAILADLAHDEQVRANNATVRGDLVNAIHFRRLSNAYLHAAAAWNSGMRPERIGLAWWLPSQSGGSGHLITPAGNCGCPSGQQPHWATALISGIDIARELLALEDVYADL